MTVFRGGIEVESVQQLKTELLLSEQGPNKWSNYLQGQFVGEIEGTFSNFSHFSQFLAKMAAFRAGIEVESVQQLKKELFLSEQRPNNWSHYSQGQFMGEI